MIEGNAKIPANPTTSMPPPWPSKNSPMKPKAAMIQKISVPVASNCVENDAWLSFIPLF
jgi:hypothetical protein